MVPGRAFIHRMYSKFTNLTEEKQLRKYHHINLDQEFKDDCRMWKGFLENHNQVGISRPFVDIFGEATAEDVQIFSDASKNFNLGYGCFFRRSWIVNQWEPGFVEKMDPSIEFLELFAVCVGIFTWTNTLKNRCFIVYCDNESCVKMLNNTSSGSKHCMTLIRNLMKRALRYNFRVFAHHVKGVDNTFSDSISRLKIRYFKYLAKKAGVAVDKFPTQASPELWPLSRCWSEYCEHLK